ncbi:hypothetical protein SGB_04655 [Shigella boydii ATCC 9905]|nr:hypothetical protein SGB_04655 [Shigella boydii ATCC 9905]
MLCKQTVTIAQMIKGHSLVRQLALNGKTRAIREQAMRKLDELY